MDKCIFWIEVLAVCWATGWLLSLVESNIRRRLDINVCEMTFDRMLLKMRQRSSKWCMIYIVICIIHIGLLVVPLVGFAWVALTSVM